MKIRRYSELSRLETFEERYEYLKVNAVLGVTTFGFDRWLNQRFYKSWEWMSVRSQVIVRDNGCDLGISGYEINSNLIVHHMNPLLPRNLKEADEWIIDPNFLITTSLRTHNAIHYGDKSLLPVGPVTRIKGDTKLW